jgi:flagellar protein FliO/FliZ
VTKRKLQEIGFAVACAILQLVTTAVHAAEGRPFAAPQATELPATGAGSFVQVTIALAIVLAAVFAAAWLMQRLRSFGGGSTGAIKVVASIALGAKERAVLVQLGKQQVLLGVAPGRVSTLHVLAEPLLSQDSGTDNAAGNGHVESPNFKALLRKSLGLS